MSRKLLMAEAFTAVGRKRRDQVNAINDDAIYAGQRLFAVIDGATSMVPHTLNGLSAAAYLSRYAVTWLTAADNDLTDTRTARELMLALNADFATHLRENFPDVAAEGKYGPSAAAVIVRLHEDGTYTYAQVADCALVEMKDGNGTLLTPDQLTNLDDGTLAAAMQRVREGCKPEDVLQDPAVNARLRANRLFNNVRFGVINGEPEMAALVCHGRRMLAGVDKLVLISDGMQAEPGKGYSGDRRLCEGAMLAARWGALRAWERLCKVYDSDPHFTRMPRFKHMDDASAVVLHFS